MVAIRGVFDFFRTPQLLYSTPGPLSRLSVHSRASFTVSFLSQAFTGPSGFSCGFGVVSCQKTLSKHSKTSSPVQIRFSREGSRPEVCSERGVCHPRKVSGEFRGVVPRPLVPTQTPVLVQKRGEGWCRKRAQERKRELATRPMFFLGKVRA